MRVKTENQHATRMRWKNIPDPTPEEGDERIVRFFAWRRVTVGDETRWLEEVAIRQTYYVSSSSWKKYAGWRSVEFLELEMPV